MGQGERAWVVVQPDYAFGTDGHAPYAIAPNELIIYDLKLVECEKVGWITLLCPR